jgi:excisionase family DNA binding protein
MRRRDVREVFLIPPDSHCARQMKNTPIGPGGGLRMPSVLLHDPSSRMCGLSVDARRTTLTISPDCLYVNAGTWSAYDERDGKIPGRLWLVWEVARALKVAPNTVYRLIRDQRLRAVRIGPRSLRIPQAELLAFISVDQTHGGRSPWRGWVAHRPGPRPQIALQQRRLFAGGCALRASSPCLTRAGTQARTDPGWVSLCYHGAAHNAAVRRLFRIQLLPMCYLDQRAV